MIEDATWQDIVAALEGDLDGYMAALARIDELATVDDVPRLRGLLEHDDQCIREGVSIPYAYLAGAAGLPDLLRALDRGFSEGHDNDGLQTALMEVVELDRAGARQQLQCLRAYADERMRENVEWLMRFVEEK